MPSNEIWLELYSQVKEKWHSVRGLVIVLTIVVALLTYIFAGIEISNINVYELLLTVAIAIIIILVWYRTSRIPKSPKNKVGFGIALVTETKEQQEKIYQDFIVTLRELLFKSKFRYQFEYIVYPQHFSEQIKSPQDASKFLKKANLRFLIYGRVRTRSINEKDAHFIQLEGVVAHRPISPEFQKQFSAEFSDLFPRRLQVLKENDIFSFELSAELIKIVAMYIISMSSLLSGDIEYSRELLEALRKELGTNIVGIPAIIKIKKRVNLRLIDVLTVYLKSYFTNWSKTRNRDDLIRATPFLDELQQVDPASYEGHVKRALWHFVINRDVEAAKEESEKCREVHFNIAWRYSYAFLLAYEGSLNKAIAEYKRAFKGVLEPFVVLDIVENIEWFLQEEPDKNQLYFCLGLIYYLKLHHNLLALESFTNFINSPIDSRFNNQKKLAEKYIDEIRRTDDQALSLAADSN